MRVDEKFNKKSATLLECQQPQVNSGGGLALGMQIQLFMQPGSDNRTLSIHLTPDEALKLAEDLVREARSYIAS